MRLFVATVVAALAAASVHLAAPAAAQENVRIRSEGAARDGWLGLSVLEELGVDREGRFTAVTITQVAPGGPAAHAGLRPRDRVVRVNGRPASPALFNQVASSLAPGQAMQLTVERPGVGTLDLVLTAASPPRDVALLLPRSIRARVDSSLHRLDSLRVTLVHSDSLMGDTVFAGAILRPMPHDGERTIVVRPERGPETARPGRVLVRSREAETDAARPLLPWVEGRSWVAGARFTELNPDLAGYFEVEGGLLVTEVLEGTPLPSAGLRPGDVVVSVDGRPVRTIDEVRAVLARAGRGPATLAVVRHGDRMEVRLGG